MGLAKILPRPIRLANFYVKAKKVAARKGIDNKSKLELIEKLERNRGDEKYFLADVKPTMLCVIGKKDIGKILIGVESYKKAIRYLESALKDIRIVGPHTENKTQVNDNTVLILFYLANANAMLGMPGIAEQYFKEADMYICDVIDNDPSNSRAVEMYDWYIVKETYNIMKEALDTHPGMEEQYYSAIRRLYEEYNIRDKGNERINKVLSWFNE